MAPSTPPKRTLPLTPKPKPGPKIAPKPIAPKPIAPKPIAPKPVAKPTVKPVVKPVVQPAPIPFLNPNEQLRETGAYYGGGSPAYQPGSNPDSGLSPAQLAVEHDRESGKLHGSNNPGPESSRKSSPDFADAYALLISAFKQYGLEDLVPAIMDMMNRNIGSGQAGLEIRQHEKYIKRFEGNKLRRNVGLNVLSEDEYLALENSYSQTMQSYGLGTYFGTDAKKRQEKMASVIGSDVSAVEFKDRIDTVVTRVENSDPTIKETLKSFYNIGHVDLIEYFLNPKEGLPKLQEKVTSAEIGAAAEAQKLTTSRASAEDLAKFGVTKQEAQKGYEAISSILPETKFLGEISKEEGINYTQQTAEEEVFKGLDSARRKRLKLAEKEIGRFSGSAGTATDSFKRANRSNY